MAKQTTESELSQPAIDSTVNESMVLPETDQEAHLLLAGRNAQLAPQLMTTVAAAEAGKNPQKYGVGEALVLMDNIGGSLNSHYYTAKPDPGFGITPKVISERKVEADQALADILTERAREYTPAGVPSQKITAGDVRKLRQVAADLGMHFIDLLAIIDCETGRQYNTGAYPLNKSKADWYPGETVGLLQWTPDGSKVNKRPGETVDQTLDRLAKQSFSEQLDELKKYFLATRPKEGQVPMTLLSAYISVFSGSQINDVTRVIYSASSTPQAYKANSSLDGCQPGTKPDGKITAAELLWRVKNHGLELCTEIAQGCQNRGMGL